MEFYPAHNRSVYDDLKNTYQHNALIPFVGAGLSVFCGYKTWPDVLRQLVTFVYNPDSRSAIETLIKKGELLQAAQKIEKQYPRIIKELCKIIDYTQIKNCEPTTLHASAAYMLPFLFRDTLVMTTNFDRVLEEVYLNCHEAFAKVVTPYEPDLLTQLRQSTPHCLFKLHGDIGPDIHDIEHLIFTQDQYDIAYCPNGALVQELSLWFQNKKLLFLGCSLAKDRTMDVLKQITKQNPGLEHYAILACKPNEIETQCRTMADLGISPIYYPDGKHEAVRILLERLLEDTHPTIYKKLPYTLSALNTPSKTEHRFMYDADYITFIGREQELAQLQEFCESSEAISWWAVTGAGGAGKSRLAHEFTKRQQKSNWKLHWLTPTDYHNLSSWIPCTEPCIVVADDIQLYLQNIGEWLSFISTQKRSQKLRILLIEREGNNIDSAKWMEPILSDSPYDDTLLSTCYRPDFLCLEPLSDHELKAIMTNFAMASDKPLTDDSIADRLLQTLQTIDSELQRPIYALAIVDAWCHGENPTRWDKKQIIDRLVKHELAFYYNRLLNLSTSRISKELRSEFELLLARSCLLPILPLQNIDKQEYPRLFKKATDLDLDFYELLRQMGIVHKVTVQLQKSKDDTEHNLWEEHSIEAVLLDCPDLIKEYLVLQQAFDKKNWDLLFPDHWDNSPFQLIFLQRVLLDYPEKLKGNSVLGKKLLDGAPTDDFSAWRYSILLFMMTEWFPSIEEAAVNRLKALRNQFSSNEPIAVTYAKWLCVSTQDQSLLSCRQTIHTLQTLYEEFPESTELAILYAKILVNLASEQSLTECKQTIVSLKLLHEQFIQNSELAVIYATGLFNLSTRQSLTECEQTIVSLKLLHNQFKQDAEIAILYAEGLVNLTSEQSLTECKQTIVSLKLLHEQFMQNSELAVQYTKGLVNLAAEQSLTECEQTIISLKLLHEQFMQNSELAVQYAKGLVNLATEQSLTECKQTIVSLKLLHNQFKQDAEIAILYAEGLGNLAAKQSLTECEQTIVSLKLLHEQFLQNSKLAVEYARGLLNLSFRQTTEATVQETLIRSKQLVSQYPNNTQLPLLYAETQFNLTLVQSPDALHQTVLKLRSYLLEHPEIHSEFQEDLDNYLTSHPADAGRYTLLRI